MEKKTGFERQTRWKRQIRSRSGIWIAPALAALTAPAGCAVEPEEPRGTAVAHVGSTGTIPIDGQCTEITSTRLSDFAVSTYRGPLAGASFTADAGEAHVTATAYPEPCDLTPDVLPWLADEQITTFAGGVNVLVLHFRANPAVTVQPQFETEHALAIRPDTSVRLLRNGEDAAGPGFSLDGWDVTELALPPAAPSEVRRFSMRGQGGFTSIPRGLARLPDGTFVAQQWETHQPLRAFSPAGAFLGAWPVVYPPGKLRWSFTDGVEAIDAAHLVRTGYMQAPIPCQDGPACIQAGIEILELGADTNGAPVAVVTEQIMLPPPYHLAYPLSVAKVGASYAVTTLVDAGTELILVAPDGALVAGPSALPGYGEGVFDAGDGRIGALTGEGELSMFDATDASPRPGEAASFDASLALGYPFALAWDTAFEAFLVLTQDKRLVRVSPDFSSYTEVGLDLSGYQQPAAMDCCLDTNRVAIADRILPLGPDGQRRPRVDFYEVITWTPVSSTTLDGVPSNLRLYSLAFDSDQQQIVSHYRVPGNAANAIDSVVYVHDLDGTLARVIDLRPLGIDRVFSVNALPEAHELLFTVRDLTGRVRLLVTALDGQPRRSYLAEPQLPIVSVSDLARIPSGPHAGDLGVVTSEPGEFLRLVLE